MHNKRTKGFGNLIFIHSPWYGQCLKVCALSSDKFILTFDNVELMEEALRNHEELDVWFKDITKWSKYEACDSRKVWVEVFGVPPRGWCWENFQKISFIWGKLISLGKPILRTDSFESMKMLIATKFFGQIEEEILLQIEDAGYRVIVREVGSVLSTVHQFQSIPHPSPAGIKVSSSGVPGFEDVNDDRTVTSNASCSHERKIDPQDDELKMMNWRTKLFKKHLPRFCAQFQMTKVKSQGAKRGAVITL